MLHIQIIPVEYLLILACASASVRRCSVNCFFFFQLNLADELKMFRNLVRVRVERTFSLCSRCARDKQQVILEKLESDYYKRLRKRDRRCQVEKHNKSRSRFSTIDTS